MNKKRFLELRSKQDLSSLHYPSAIEWIWDYCLFIGSFTDSLGRNYDLGIYCYDDGRVSAATVYEDRPGAYFSGDFMTNNHGLEHYEELKRLYQELKQS